MGGHWPLITAVTVGIVIGAAILVITAALLSIDQRMIRIDEHLCELITSTESVHHPGNCG